MKSYSFFLLSLLFLNVANAQNLDVYRSKDNPYYWKNKMPDAAYWQQDVAYKIEASVDETTHIISASETLEYVNNSPDTLTFVYFHLFQNAFVKGSHLHELEKASKVPVRMGKYEKAGLGTSIENLKVDGRSTWTELDNTILKVYLPKPLLPHGSVKISMDFKTYFDNGATRRRMKMYPAWGFMHYNGVQWFPKICVYDRKFGWDTYQHLNKEFYGDFGVYDVSLNFAANYIVEATGALQNREEVLPAALREKLDMKNFASKPWNEPPSTIIPYQKDARKTWHFYAENVHDFAFTADPSYRIATAYQNGVECVGLAQEPHASAWQHSAELVAKIIETFSEDVGMYAYPKMVAADAADGMEYPMLTLDGGGEPGYRGLLVHEIGHNWFYGMVGSNETYRAAMDEGFTQFLTAWGLNRIDGKFLRQEPPRSAYRRRFYEPVNTRDSRVYNAYIATALKGESLPLNTHSNDFNNALGHEGGYGMVYYKTAAMLYNLQYVLGDSLFLAAMQHYFGQWKMAHPYFEDFKNSIIHFTKVDLNWFFDEWFETTKKIDYAVRSIKKVKGTDSFAISFERKGQMQMPVDFTVTQKNGSSQSYHIPNTWFKRDRRPAVSSLLDPDEHAEAGGNTAPPGYAFLRGATNEEYLPKWYGWGKMYERYTAYVKAPSGVKHVVIDPSGRLADIYPLDNTKTRGRPFRPLSVKWKWDGGMNTPADRHRYRVYARPDVWWNAVDGIKPGAHIEGSYMNIMHRLDAGIWWNTHVLQENAYLSYQSERYYQRYSPVNFTFNYTSPVSYNHPGHEEQLNIRYLEGLAYGKIGHNWRPSDNILAQIYFQAMWRPKTYDADYLLYPNEWSSNSRRPNNSLNILLSRNYRTEKSYGSAAAAVRAPLLAGNEVNAFNYSYAQLEVKNVLRLRKFELHSRLFGRAGMGKNIPYESALWLSGANPEDLMENKYTRSAGFVPDNWQGISRYDMNHFQQGGGLNLRGYAGYLVADERNGDVLTGYKGRSGASLSLELDYEGYISLKPKLTRNWLHIDAYAFADGGIIELSKMENVNEYYNMVPTTRVSDFRIDAGLGFAATIRKWGVFEKARPFTLRFDMPFFLNRPPYAAPQYWGFRYVVGINRAF